MRSKFILPAHTLLCLALWATLAPATDQPATPSVVIDARTRPAAPRPLPFPTGGSSPNGHTLSANSRYLTLDGKPWLPVMGEFHFSRYPESGWEEELLKMKAGGVRIVSTYIFWIHHEEIEGQFDWSGRRNLRRFVELCAKHGLFVWIRVGPWDHGEVRNGGFPDWLLSKCQTRQNDPVYLDYVRRLYGEIGQQVKGQFWKDGGPIIGVQLENEYSASGPGKGPEHILTLLRLAHEAGLAAPFYTITGWDAAGIPSEGVLPVYGGYADGFWYRELTDLPPDGTNYFFSKHRCGDDAGNALCKKYGEQNGDPPYPQLTAEMGGGMALAYHRRPAISADDTAAMELVRLGSGVAVYGFYMFHGGTNPEGKKTTLQESQATGYVNDLTVKSYDFQAPLGEFGQLHESYRAVKLMNLFLQDFGAELAPMTTYLPQQVPENERDTATPRIAARLQSDHGFLFINNYQRTYPLPARKQFQVRLDLPSGALNVPRTPVNIPSGAYSIWPVNLDLGAATLRYATAQLLTSLDDPQTFVFFASPGVPAEFVFDQKAGISVTAPHAHLSHTDGTITISGIEPGLQNAIELRNKNGGTAHIVVLSREQAGDIWKTKLAGRERLLLSPSSVFAEQGRVHLRGSDPSQLTLSAFPQLDSIPAGFTDHGDNGIFHRYDATVQPMTLQAKLTQVKQAEVVPPAKIGRDVALAPQDADFHTAARWSIQVPAIQSKAVKKMFLRISYEGDVARIYAGDHLLTDNFYNGAPWVIGLPGMQSGLNLNLTILPLRRDAPVYIPLGSRPEFPASGQVARVKDIQLMPEYEAIVERQP